MLLLRQGPFSRGRPEGAYVMSICKRLVGCNMKKNLSYFFVAAVLFGSSFLFMPRLASAATADEIQAQIQNLMAQIKQLQQQLTQIQGSAVQCHDFNTNLRIGDSGNEVSWLQTVLEKEGFNIDDSEQKGGSELGESTAAAVSGFQQKYKDEILAPAGLAYGNGFAGRFTRTKLNQLYGCGAEFPVPQPRPVPPQPIPTPVPFPIPGGTVSEQVKCVFNETATEQKCYAAVDTTSPYAGLGCSGVGACAVNVTGGKGGQITWKSSCGGYAYTTVDGVNEYAEFKCSSVSSSIQVISPNGGESLLAGQTHNIRWSSFNVPPSTNVNIWLLDEPTHLGQIVLSDVANTGSASWTVSSIAVYNNKNNSYVTPSGKWVILIECAGHSCTVDNSDAPFSITAIPPPADQSARDAERISGVNKIRLALELYYDTYGSYPLTLASLAPVYIVQVPRDPLSGKDYFYVNAPDGMACGGTRAAPCKNYHLGASLEVASSAALAYDADQNSSLYTKDGFDGADRGECLGLNPFRELTYRYCYDVVGATIVPPSASTLMVVADSSIPMPATVLPGQAGVTFARVKFSASGSSPILIKRIVIGSDYPDAVGNLYNIKILDSGAVVGFNFPGGLDISGNLSMYFSDPLIIPANGSKTLVIVADVSAKAASGKVRLGVGLVAFSYAGHAVTGLPAYGNVMTIQGGSAPVQVLSPNGGENWTLGSTQMIRWSAPSDVQYVDIVLTCDSSVPQYMCNPLVSVPVLQIATHFPNSGGYSWVVGSGYTNFAPGKYVIKISDNSNSSRVDSSDGPFGITASAPAPAPTPTVRILSPNGGEVVAAGAMLDVKWVSSADQRYQFDLVLVPQGFMPRDANYSSEIGGYYMGGISPASYNGSSYSTDWGNSNSWGVPTSVAGNYKLKIYQSKYPTRGGYSFVSEAVAVDDSDASFSIAGPVSEVPKLYFLLDPTSPPAATLMPGKSGVEFAKFRLSSGSTAVNNLNQIQLASDSLNVLSNLANVKLFDGPMLLGSVALVDFNGSYYYSWVPVGGLSIPANSSKVLTITADINPGASGSARLGIAGFNAGSPGVEVVPFGTAIYGNTMNIVSGVGALPAAESFPAGSAAASLLEAIKSALDKLQLEINAL